MSLNTILCFARATAPEDLFTGQRHSRRTKLDANRPYPGQRWKEGCTNAWMLWEEIKEQGYPDGYGSVRAYVGSTLRSKPQPVGPRPPSARTVTRRVLARPDALPERDRLQLKGVLANCRGRGRTGEDYARALLRSALEGVLPQASVSCDTEA